MQDMQTFSFWAMGSECTIYIYAASSVEATRVADLAIKEVFRIEKKYSRYLAQSELSRINNRAAAGESVKVDGESGALLDLACEYFIKSDGLFDITSGRLRRVWDFGSGKLPPQELISAELEYVGFDKVIWESPQLSFSKAGIELDFGGIAKEYAADRAAAVCFEQGIKAGLVNLAGDITVIGPHPDGSGWKITVSDPKAPELAACTVVLSSGAMATSGDYARCIEVEGRRYGHIINPRTGWPAHGFSSVSVQAMRCIEAGLQSTIAILKEANGEQFLRENAANFLWIDEIGNVNGQWPPFV